MKSKEKQINDIWSVVKIVPSDYTVFGGTIQRWEHHNQTYPDCSTGCKYYRKLISEYEMVEDADWGVCMNPKSDRAGLLTFEHQNGYKCYEGNDYD